MKISRCSLCVISAVTFLPTPALISQAPNGDQAAESQVASGLALPFWGKG